MTYLTCQKRMHQIQSNLKTMAWSMFVIITRSLFFQAFKGIFI